MTIHHGPWCDDVDEPDACDQCSLRYRAEDVAGRIDLYLSMDDRFAEFVATAVADVAGLSWDDDDTDALEELEVMTFRALGQRYLCPNQTGLDECGLIRERSVVGTSNEIPACPVHGAHPDMK